MNAYYFPIRILHTVMFQLVVLLIYEKIKSISVREYLNQLRHALENGVIRDIQSSLEIRRKQVNESQTILLHVINQLVTHESICHECSQRCRVSKKESRIHWPQAYRATA